VDLIGKVSVTNNSITVQVATLKFSATDLGGFPSKFLSKLLNAAVPSIILPALNGKFFKSRYNCGFQLPVFMDIILLVLHSWCNGVAIWERKAKGAMALSKLWRNCSVSGLPAFMQYT